MESVNPAQCSSIKTHNSERSLRLPEEIIEEILSRLPVQSLLKFRCVSKPWRALIDSKHFIKKHLNNSTKSPNFAHHNILAISSEPQQHFIKKHLNNSTKSPNFAHHNILAISSEPQLGLKQYSLISVLNGQSTAQFTSFHSTNSRLNSICIVDCCNGVVCLLLDIKHFMLWNPSTRKTKKLPHIDGRIIKHGYMSSYGFGYDDLSGDYMVLGIASFFGSSGIYETLCKVYSLQTNSWKIVEVENVDTFYRAGFFASGKIHWRERNGYITYFDLRSEVFDVIKAPPITNVVSYKSMRVFGGRLGILYNDGVGKLDIWVIKEYGVNSSWEKVANIPYFNTFPGTPILFLLGRGPNGEILLTTELNFEIFYPEGNGFRHCQGWCE